MQESTSIEIQAVAAVVIPHVIEWLKDRQWFPWLEHNDESAVRIASGIFAVLTNAGLAVTLNANWESGARLIIDLPAIGSGTLRTVLSYIGQQYVYASHVQRTQQTLKAKVTKAGTVTGTLEAPVPVPEPDQPVGG